GTAEIDGVSRRVRVPLLTEPVRLEPLVRNYRVTPAGDLELTRLVTDSGVAARLEAAVGEDLVAWLRSPDAPRWIEEAAAAAGFTRSAVVTTGGPDLPVEKLVGVAAAALYPVRDVLGFSMTETLRRWSRLPGLDDTAFAALYGYAPPLAEVGRAAADGR